MNRDLVNVVAAVSAVLVLAVGGPWIVREVRSLERTAPLAARAGQRIATLEVSGMTCSGCAKAIEQKLAALPGVTTAAVRLRARRAYVVCEQSTADTTLIAAIERAGSGFDAVVAER